MRTPRARRALLPALLAAALLVPASPAGAGDAPVGGARLTGTSVVSDPAEPAPPPTTAASYVVADLDSGAVLAAKDPHGQYAPASTLKTLTALTLIPRLDPAAHVSPTQQDLAVDGTKVGLVPSLSYSTKELFTALLVVSANDAATTLASAAGGEPAVARLMNARAAQLSARDTHAVNASGLDADGQVSSAYDLALVARAAMALPDFRAYVGVRRSTIPAPGGQSIEIDTHDKLLLNYPGAIGIKNGFTEAARASFVGAARRDGHTLVVVVMRGEPNVWKDAAALLDWGFVATSHGAPSVGRLVDPVAAGDPAASPAPSAAGAASGGGAAAAGGAPARAASGSGGLPAAPLTVGAGALGVLVVLRRRAVVRARARRRRRAARAAAPVPAGR